MVLVSKSHAHIIAPNPQTHEIIIQKQVFFFFPGRGISVNVTKKSHHFHLPIFQLIYADTRELPWNYFKKKKRKKKKSIAGLASIGGPHVVLRSQIPVLGCFCPTADRPCRGFMFLRVALPLVCPLFSTREGRPFPTWATACFPLPASLDRFLYAFTGKNRNPSFLQFIFFFPPLLFSWFPLSC